MTDLIRSPFPVTRNADGELSHDFHANAEYVTANRDATADLAAEARHGGRYITEVLARVLTPTGTFPFGAEQTRAVLAGEGARFNYPPDALRDLWRGSLSPSGSEYPSTGRETTARYARKAATGVDVFGHPLYGPLDTLPVAAFDWPIYRAAMYRPVATAWEAARIAYAPDSATEE